MRQPASVAASSSRHASSWHVGRNPSALMRAPHHLHGVLDVTPLLGFICLALVLASLGIAGRLGDRLVAKLNNHLPGDGVDLHLGYHVALPGVPPLGAAEIHSVVPLRLPSNRWTAGLVPLAAVHNLSRARPNDRS